MVAYCEPEMRLVKGTMFSRDIVVVVNNEIYGFSNTEMLEVLSTYLDCYVRGDLFPHEVMWGSQTSEEHKLAWYELWLIFKD